jgi:hypothetical protein
MHPGEPTNSGEAGFLSRLSREQLGNWFVIQQRYRLAFGELRREFVRRFWIEQEEAAAAGRPLRLYPFDRP